MDEAWLAGESEEVVMANVVELPRGDRDAVKIGRLYDRARRSLLDSVPLLIEVGQLLLAKKATLPHGGWLPWLRNNVGDLGFSYKTAQRLLAVGKFTVTGNFNEADMAEVIRQIWGNAGPVRGTAGTGENEWFTPEQYIAMVRCVLGEIDLDPATSAAAQGVVKAKKFFTKSDDGLAHEWFGRVWLNPPYAQPLIAQFISKLCREWRDGRVSAAIVLTHNYTDTAWFAEIAAQTSALCFTRGRVKFYDGDEIAAPTQGQVFSYLGHDADRFSAAFEECGFVAVPWRERGGR